MTIDRAEVSDRNGRYLVGRNRNDCRHAALLGLRLVSLVRICDADSNGRGDTLVGAVIVRMYGELEPGQARLAALLWQDTSTGFISADRQLDVGVCRLQEPGKAESEGLQDSGGFHPAKATLARRKIKTHGRVA